ncbi:MAG: hypothetical protein ACT4OJ_15825 [Bacteroidota bacterium]
MIIKFEIEDIVKIESRNKVFVFAMLLNPGLEWRLSDNAKLGDVEIEPRFQIPRKIDENGNIRLDFFAFELKNNEDKDHLSIHQVVDLKY